MSKRDTDFLDDCNPQGQQHYLPPAQFTHTFCARCRNSECMRAKYADSAWLHRMETQPGLLLDHPIFSDLQSAEHARINGLDFKDMFAEAMRLEISAQRGDWSPVERIGSDGVNEINPDASGVDSALDALAALKGKKRKPRLPVLQSGVESPDQSRTPESSRLAPKSEGQQKKDRALAEMARRMGVDVGEQAPPPAAPKSEEPAPAAPAAPAPPPEPEKEAAAQPVKQPPKPQGNNPYTNTPLPNRGIMVDDSPHPQRQSGVDPWAPKPKENVVDPHTTITFGKGEKKDD